jgi:hypothetical protein
MTRGGHVPSWQDLVEKRAAEHRLPPGDHLVADCRLRKGEPVWVLCSCGVTVTPDDAESLSAAKALRCSQAEIVSRAFSQHRIQAGLRAPTLVSVMNNHRAYS